MLTRESTRLLQKDGFIPEELEQLHNSREQVAIDSPVWLAVRRTRREWVAGLRKQGWKPEKIAAAIDTYYQQRGKRSIYEYLRSEYRPEKRIDYLSGVASRARRRVTDGLRDAVRQVQGRR